MISQKFEELYKKLNLAQKEAVDAIDGPVMVIAGPGTGKTTVLTLRIANILKKTDTSPDSILALTFTDSGVAAMRKALVKIIGAATYRVNIHTFHSFANEIIKKYPSEFPRIIGSQHITDIDQIRIMEKIIDETKLKRLKPAMTPYYYLKPALDHIKELKREDIDQYQFEEIVLAEEKNFEKTPDLYYESGKWKGEMKGKYKDIEKRIKNNLELIVLYQKYQEALLKGRFYDYEDMIMEVVRVLKTDKDLLLRLQEEYQYILADEHQDANNAQNKLLELISGFHDNPNLFIVGDEKQAIFRFQGASLENFLYFEKKYPRATLVRLTENYRSGQALLDASHSLIGNNARPDKKLLVRLISSARANGAKIKLAELPTVESEYAFLAEGVKQRIKDGITPESIAILYRNNKDAAGLQNFFDRKGIATAVHSDHDLFSDEDIWKLLLILRAAENPSDSSTLAKMLYVDFLGLNNLDIHRVIRQSADMKVPLFRFIRLEKLLEDAGVESSKSFIILAEKLHRWSSLAKNQGLLTALETIAEDSGFLSHLVSLPNSLQKLSLYDTFLNNVKNTVERHKDARLADFLNFLNTLSEHDVRVKSDAFGEVAGRVNLMTVHKSKGLEFNVVFIIHATDSRWGGGKSHGTFFTIPGMNLADETEIDDERRLFYVALTRARQEAIITRSLVGATGKEELPSQFLAEIDLPNLEPVDVSKFNNLSPEIYAEPKNFHGSGITDVKDKAYLQELFLTQGLSVTALNNYLRCPWQYFFVNLIRIPKSEEKPQLYGTAVHETLKDFFDAYHEEADMPKKKILEIFEARLARKPLRSEDFAELLEKGRKALSGYYDFYKNRWPRAIMNEFKIGGVFLEIKHDGKKIDLLIKGNLDKIELLSDSQVNVVDYKTGKPRTRNEILGKTKSSDGDYSRQIVFYRLLLDNFALSKYRMVSGETDFIEPDDRGKYRREKFEVSDREIEELKKTIAQTASEILSLSFFGTTCDDKNCEYCKLGALVSS